MESISDIYLYVFYYLVVIIKVLYISSRFNDFVCLILLLFLLLQLLPWLLLFLLLLLLLFHFYKL